MLVFAAGPAQAEAAQEPTEIDTTMEDLLGDDRAELLLEADKLDLRALDYSLESLTAIDVWLGAVHATNLEEAGEGRAGATLTGDGRGRNTVTLAGIYLGETIKRNSGLGWEWVPFDEFIAENPAFAEHYGTDAGLDEYVLVGEQGVATPINSALKRVLNGPQDSVAHVGAFLSKPIDFEKAIEGYDPGPEPNIIRRELDKIESDPGSGRIDVDSLLEAAGSSGGGAAL